MCFRQSDYCQKCVILMCLTSLDGWDVDLRTKAVMIGAALTELDRGGDQGLELTDRRPGLIWSATQNQTNHLLCGVSLQRPEHDNNFSASHITHETARCCARLITAVLLEAQNRLPSSPRLVLLCPSYRNLQASPSSYRHNIVPGSLESRSTSLVKPVVNVDQRYSLFYACLLIFICGMSDMSAPKFLTLSIAVHRHATMHALYPRR